MPYMLVRHKVEDYERWKPGFEGTIFVSSIHVTGSSPGESVNVRSSLRV